MNFWTITKQQAKDFLDDLRDEIEHTAPEIKINYFSKRGSSLGNTIENKDGTTNINILCEGFDSENEINKIIPVNKTSFAISVVLLQHECRHAQQLGKYPSSGDISDAVLISQYVSKENSEWYIQHYTEQLCEIDAEMNALYRAHSKLEKAFPGHGEELVLKYVNYRIDKDNEAIRKGTGMKYYVHSRKHFTSLDDVFEKFENTLTSTLKSKRLYTNETNFNVCKDTVALGMDIKNYDLSVWKEHIDVLYGAKTGIESDLLMASFTNYAKGNAYDNPLLEHINLDIEELYGIPPAQSQDELAIYMKENEYEASAYSNRISGQLRHSDEQEIDDFEL